MSNRTFWNASDLGIEDEPLIMSLLKYRQRDNRVRVTGLELGDEGREANLVSSVTDDGKQMPIIDLDFAHAHVESTNTGHAHLYLNVPISRWRWTALMIGLYLSKQVEMGYFVWSLRRGGNFVRLPGVAKQGERETRKPTYGWFRRIKT